MTNRDIATHYAISTLAAIAIGTQIAKLTNPLIGIIACCITFVAVSWLQTHEREHRRNP